MDVRSSMASNQTGRLQAAYLFNGSRSTPGRKRQGSTPSSLCSAGASKLRRKLVTPSQNLLTLAAYVIAIRIFQQFGLYFASLASLTRAGPTIAVHHWRGPAAGELGSEQLKDSRIL